MSQEGSATLESNTGASTKISESPNTSMARRLTSVLVIGAASPTGPPAGTMVGWLAVSVGGTTAEAVAGIAGVVGTTRASLEPVLAPAGMVAGDGCIAHPARMIVARTEDESRNCILRDASAGGRVSRRDDERLE